MLDETEKNSRVDELMATDRATRELYEDQGNAGHSNGVSSPLAGPFDSYARWKQRTPR